MPAHSPAQRDVLTQALRKIPPALDVLIKERPRLTTALDKLRVFSNTATGLINDTQADLVKNLKNLEPTIRALADVGPELDTALAASSVFPFTQNFVDRAVRGDYFNLHVQLDLTIPRLKRGLMLGTHWGQLGEQPMVPAPGDPYYLNYTHDPLHGGLGRRLVPPLPGRRTGRRTAGRPQARRAACSAESPVQRSATGTRCRRPPGVWSTAGPAAASPGAAARHRRSADGGGG